MTGEALTANISELVAPVLDRLGYDLEDVAVLTPPGRRDIRIVIDRDGGASLDDLADVSRELDPVLEGANLLGETPYDLEVTTPGIGRPLTLPRHWRRNQGRKAKVEYRVDGVEKSVEVRIGASDDTQVTLVTVDKSRITSVDVAFADIVRGVVEVDFSRPGEAALRACGLSDEEIARRREPATHTTTE
ncbi:ribosome maturation factor RimP [Gordonia phthalatica]|uniref:Ribosome maturation factor RimP n=1 Tax=Gordonia phthalatica TaxID=1136941 RepID=A0A0N9NL15_9ACTN|nr:ribosome maturation factor RimP [Gordonia phthalatica]ALG86736.1 ribosome maturation factor RimP [Gordonia phthalatica]